MSYSGRIAYQTGGDRGRDRAGEFQLFVMGVYRQHTGSRLHQFGWRKLLSGNFQLARFNLGEIENVIDDCKQGSG